MLDRCKSAQSKYSFSDYISAGKTIEKNGCSITNFTNSIQKNKKKYYVKIMKDGQEIIPV